MVETFNSQSKCRGHSFLSLNEGLLERYADCTTSAEVIQVQNDYLESLHNPQPHSSDDDEDDDGRGGYLANRDLPPTDSDEYQHTSDEEEEEIEREAAAAVEVVQDGISKFKVADE